MEGEFVASTQKANSLSTRNNYLHRENVSLRDKVKCLSKMLGETLDDSLTDDNLSQPDKETDPLPAETSLDESLTDSLGSQPENQESQPDKETDPLPAQTSLDQSLTDSLGSQPENHDTSEQLTSTPKASPKPAATNTE